MRSSAPLAIGVCFVTLLVAELPVSSSAAPTPWATVSRASTPLPAGALPTGGDLTSAATVSGLITLQPADPLSLERFVDAVSTPGSPEYSHYLSAGQFGSRFGAPPATIATVVSWLHSQGITTTSVPSDDLSVQFTSSAARASTAFDVHLADYRLRSGEVVFAPTAAPRVPASLAGSITDVAGLSDVTQLRPHLELGPRDAAPSSVSAGAEPGEEAPSPLPHLSSTSGPQACQDAQDTAADYGGYTATQIASAYGLSSVYSQGRMGAGVTVGIAEFETSSAADISEYQSCMGTDTPVSTVMVATPDDRGNPYPGLETALDVETIIGLAPLSNVLVYEGNDDTAAGELDVYTTIADDDVAKVVTTSWGQCEALTASGQQQDEGYVFEQMAAQGQSMFAAAGDTGSEDCFGADYSTALAVDDPGSQPDVTSVGGTSMTSSGYPPTESVWNDCQDKAYSSCAVEDESGAALGAGGGGGSSTFESPSWQGFSGARQVPDVAASADPEHGTVIYSAADGVGWQAIGGTSAAAPVWAALTADVDQGCAYAVGEFDPKIYALARESGTTYFNDITTGNNDFTDTNDGEYPATTGYDMASGWGSPNAAQLVTGLQPSGGCPTVTGMSQSSGYSTGGTIVVISGDSLQDTTAVNFGSSSASYTIDNDDQVTAVAPANSAGTVNVTLTTPNGTSAPVTGGQFTYQAAPSPAPPFPGTPRDPDLLTDTNFAQGLGPWDLASGQNWALYDTSPAPVGGDYLETNAGDASGPNVSQIASAAPAAGHSYQASVYLRSPSSTPVSVSLVIWALGGTAPEEAQNDFTVSSSSWNSYATDLDVMESGHTELIFQLYLGTSGSNLDIDGARLQDAGLSDAGFEAGLGSWNLTPGQNWAVYDSASAPMGSDYLETNSGAIADPTVYEDMAGAPVAGHSYQGSVYLRSPSSTPVSVTLVVWALGGPDTEIGQSDFTVSSSSWAPYYTDLDVADSGHSDLRFQIYIGTLGANLDIDGAALDDTEVPDAAFDQSGLGPWVVSSGANWAIGSGPGGVSGSGQDWLETNTASGSSSSFYEDIATDPVVGHCYTASMFLKSLGTEPITVTVVIWALGGSGPVEAGVTTATVGTSWQQYAAVLDVTNPGHDDLRVQVYLSTAGQTLGADLASVPDVAAGG